MLERAPDATPKIHPATREILPDDPLEMHAFEVPGDPHLMVRLLVEEYARLGFGPAAIVQLARDPNYRAFHGLLRFFGEEELTARVRQIVARCGVMRVSTKEAALPPTELVQIESLSFIPESPPARGTPGATGNEGAEPCRMFSTGKSAAR